MLLGRAFVFGLRTKKTTNPKNLKKSLKTFKNLKNLFKPVFFQPWDDRYSKLGS